MAYASGKPNWCKLLSRAKESKCCGLINRKLLGFYSHHHSSLWEEKFCNPIHAAAGRIETVKSIHGKIHKCLLTENLQARTVTVVILGTKLLLYTQEDEKHYYDFMIWGYRLFPPSSHFRPSPVDTSVKFSKGKLLALVLYFMSHEPLWAGI